MEETYHVTLNEADEELSAAKQKLMLLDSAAEGSLMLLSQVKTVNDNIKLPSAALSNSINFCLAALSSSLAALNARCFSSRSMAASTPKLIVLSLADDYPIQNELDDVELADNHNDVSKPQNITSKYNPINEADPSPTIISTSTEVNLDTPIPQDRWSRDKHILLVNILGYRQEEWINYDETLALVARLKDIKIFLAYATYMGFVVYQMDVKSAFLNGKISKEEYVQQPPGFERSEFLNHVCKVDKALYWLK
nr:retrovirus-related Pol polyprotein from transposon TNT 1-94 [Tanacetum cinerariifolium]